MTTLTIEQFNERYGYNEDRFISATDFWNEPNMAADYAMIRLANTVDLLARLKWKAVLAPEGWELLAQPFDRTDVTVRRRFGDYANFVLMEEDHLTEFNTEQEMLAFMLARYC